MKHQPEIKAIDEFGMTMTILEPSNISMVPRLIVGTLWYPTIHSSFAGSLHPHSWPKKSHHGSTTPRQFPSFLETENEGLTPYTNHHSSFWENCEGELGFTIFCPEL